MTTGGHLQEASRTSYADFRGGGENELTELTILLLYNYMRCRGGLLHPPSLPPFLPPSLTTHPSGSLVLPLEGEGVVGGGGGVSWTHFF